jgi:uncharacterized protein YhaN
MSAVKGHTSATPAVRPPRSSLYRERRHDERVELVRQVIALRAALEASATENAQLRRRLVRSQAEIARLRQPSHQSAASLERENRFRCALCEPWSRNP